MEWKGRRNVEISQTGPKFRLIFVKIEYKLSFYELLKVSHSTFGVSNGVERALKRRSISNSTEITINFRQNRVTGDIVRAEKMARDAFGA
jgi:hypothetical protein